MEIKGAGQDQIVQSGELAATHSQIQAAVSKLVWKNESLRSKIISDPKGVLEKELGIKFSSNINVKVIDQEEANTVHFVLPHHPGKILGVDLNDEQLDAIAGGFSFSIGLAGIGFSL